MTTLQLQQPQPAEAAPSPIRGRLREWAPLVVLMIGTFMIVLDFFIVNVALPSIQTGLHAGTTAIEWVVASYGLTFAVFLIAAGRDRRSRRATAYVRPRPRGVRRGLGAVRARPVRGRAHRRALRPGHRCRAHEPEHPLDARRRVSRRASGPRHHRLRHRHGHGGGQRPAHRWPAHRGQRGRRRMADHLPHQRPDRAGRPRPHAPAAARVARRPGQARRRDGHGAGDRRPGRPGAAAGAGPRRRLAGLDVGELRNLSRCSSLSSRRRSDAWTPAGAPRSSTPSCSGTRTCGRA